MAYLIYKSKKEFHALEVEVIDEFKSNYQTIRIANTKFGKALILDDYIQFAEKDESLFHKHFALPLIKNNKVNDALVLGGGDLLLASVIASYTKVDVVELDKDVVNITKKHFSNLHKNLDKVNVIIGDALRYDKPHDAVFVDLIDTNQNYDLYNEAAVKHYKSLAKKYLVMHSSLEFAYETFNIPKRLFTHSVFYTSYIPSFNTLWVFGIFSDYNININNVWRISFKELIRWRDNEEDHFCEADIKKCIDRLEQ